MKFNVFPRADALHCLKLLLADFTYHNIEMACALLETCGRFLYRTLDSHNRTKVYLEVMLRKKTAMHMDQRYQTLIENAYYYRYCHKWAKCVSFFHAECLLPATHRRASRGNSASSDRRSTNTFASCSTKTCPKYPSSACCGRCARWTGMIPRYLCVMTSSSDKLRIFVVGQIVCLSVLILRLEDPL